MAAAGKIPGARQPSGTGGHWTFDAKELSAWWREQKKEVSQWPGYTNEVKYIGRAPSVTGLTTAEASKLRIDKLLKGVLGSG